MLTRLALASALGLTLDALNIEVWSAGFWCVIGLFVAYGWLVRTEVETEIMEYHAALRRRLEQILKKQQESEEAPK